MSEGCSAIATDESSSPVVNMVAVPNKLPAISMPTYTNSQIEEYLKNMEEANGEVHKIWQTFTERWEASDDAEYDNDFIDWLSKRADKLINLREVLLLKTMASFETYQQTLQQQDNESDKTSAEQTSQVPEEAEEAAGKFEQDFKAVTFVNKIIYCIARAHNLKEEEAVKRYQESLKKQDDERPADNINFE